MVTFRENTKRNDSALKVTLAVGGLATMAILAFVYWRYREIAWELLIIVTLGMLLVWLSLSSYGNKPPRTLTLDDDGLTYANGRFSRRWTWDALSAAELHGHDPQMEPQIRIRVDAIDWKARLTLLESLSKSEIILRAIYEAPLRDICDKLNEYRDRALGGGQ